MPVIETDPETAREQLATAGATFEEGNTDHERWRATLGEATAVAYEDKIVIQGNRPREIETVLENHNGRGHLYFDGASHGNPGPAAIGWVLLSGDGIIAEAGERIGQATNNQAEYQALIEGLKVASEYGLDDIHIRGDSELIVKQVTGTYAVDNPTLKEFRVTVRELLRDFDDWSITHIPRELNERANDLASEALDD